MKTTALFALLSTASAATIRIDVGKSGLTFSPDTVTAQKGDVLEYHFHGPYPHSVAQSDFSGPCNPSKTGGFYSGTVSTNGNGENANVFQVTVNSTSPIFFYCAVPGHCAGGMVGVVNPSSSGSETLSAYKNAAKNAHNSAPAAVFGGVLGPAKDDSSSSSSSSASSSSSSSSAPASGTDSTSTLTPTPTATATATGGNTASGGSGGGASGGGKGSGGSALAVSVVGVLGGMIGVTLLMI